METVFYAAINEQQYLPGRLSSLGLFREEGITTLTVQIEKDGDTLALVPAGERGTSGLVVGASKRVLIPFNTVHLPQRFTIKADIEGLQVVGQAESGEESLLKARELKPDVVLMDVKKIGRAHV